MDTDNLRIEIEDLKYEFKSNADALRSKINFLIFLLIIMGVGLVYLSMAMIDKGICIGPF